MHTFMTVLLVSWLGLWPLMAAAGTAGTTGEQRPEQKLVITKENVKLIQERLTAEGVYAGPLDGELHAQTEAALRAYQQKRRLPVSGAADEATLKELQIELPTSRGEER